LKVVVQTVVAVDCVVVDDSFGGKRNKNLKENRE